MPDYPDPRFRLTPRRREYLERMADVGHCDEDGSRAEHDCAVLGWTRYCYRDPAVGDFIDADTARERYGDSPDDWFPKVEKAGMMITKYGREALNYL